MRTRPIEFVELRETTVWHLHEDAFSLKPENGWVWLQRLCFWVLRKLRCYYNEPSVEVTRHVVSPDDFMERFFQQCDALDVLRSRPEAILMGAEDYRDLMHSPLACEAFSFDAQYNSPGRIHGVTVIVLPTVRGMAVLPSLESVKKVA